MTNFYAGIDIGSTMTKVVIMTDEIVTSVIGPTGAQQRHLANRVMETALKQAGFSIDALTFITATGYGRINVPFADKQVTEITCHAKGVVFLFPRARTVIDVGGQDSKAIKLAGGRAVDFVMNDKCAAGSGRFLEIIADTLGMTLQELAETSLQSTSPITIGTLCTIFAEQEVANRRAQGAPLPDLIAGVHEALAARIASLARRIGVEEQVVLTGGGAKNDALLKALSDKLAVPLLRSEEPLITGAVGAALVGKELVKKAEKAGRTVERKERVLAEVNVH